MIESLLRRKQGLLQDEKPRAGEIWYTTHSGKLVGLQSLFKSYYKPVTNYKHGQINIVTYKPSVTKFSRSIFSQKQADLRTVILPDSITSVPQLIYYCINIDYVEVPQNLQEVTNQMFCQTMWGTDDSIGTGTNERVKPWTRPLLIPATVTSVKDYFARGSGVITCYYKSSCNLTKGCFLSSLLENLILESPTLVEAFYQAFDGYPASIYWSFRNHSSKLRIFVPDELIEDYKAHATWAPLKSKIFPISQWKQEQGEVV